MAGLMSAEQAKLELLEQQITLTLQVKTHHGLPQSSPLFSMALLKFSSSLFTLQNPMRCRRQELDADFVKAREQANGILLQARKYVQYVKELRDSLEVHTYTYAMPDPCNFSTGKRALVTLWSRRTADVGRVLCAL
jgi:hypothetical protein